MTDLAGKKLYRSRENRMITGVCGGIAEWLEWDPTIVRVLCVLVVLASGAFPGVVAYVVLAIVVPEAPPSGRRPRPESEAGTRTGDGSEHPEGPSAGEPRPPFP